MADRLTQLQDALDQFVACLHYVNAHHDYATLSQGDSVRKTEKKDGDAGQETIEPYSGEDFRAGLRELAQDLIIKEQQIEVLIPDLPGLRKSESDQQERIAELEVELRSAELERQKAIQDKDAMIEQVESVIRSMKRP